MTLQRYDGLSEAELDRIERLAEAATQGPWFSYVAGRDAADGSSWIELGACNELGSFRSMELIGGTAADQDFIASARQDVPRLLLEVRALRACLDSLCDAEISSRMRALRGATEESAAQLPAMM